MTKSNLTNITISAHASNYAKQRNSSIKKITVHHMAGNMSVETCGHMFQGQNRGASSNYGIGSDGRIASYVGEESRSFCSSNPENDSQAITIEVANNGGKPSWSISDKAWDSLVKLCIDICTRYNFKLSYDGTKNGSLTRHNMFAATTCPGPYLQGRFNELVSTVNKALGTPTAQTPTNPANDPHSVESIAREVIAGKWGVGQSRKDRLIKAGYNYDAVQRRVNEILGVKTTTVTSNKKSNETIADEVIKGFWGNGQDRKDRLTRAGYNYSAIQTIVNRKLR